MSTVVGSLLSAKRNHLQHFKSAEVKKTKKRLNSTTRWHCDCVNKDIDTDIRRGVYPVRLQEHVDHPGRSVAPVHQQVPVVPDAGRVVSGGEPEAADVVDAGLHQPVHVLLRADEAGLRTER